MASLDIFEHRFGDEAHPGHLSDSGDNTLGDAGMRMLDAIQTVADVLADGANSGYRVGFAATSSAFTDHKEKRITISGLPLTRAAAGTPYRDIAAVLTGFAVHEIGHTKNVGIINAVKAEWPGKKLPAVLGNIIEDMVLEARVIERFAGLRDVFTPTFEWVAKETCPTTPLKWGGSTGHKVNIAGQIVRYRPYVTFTADAETQRQLRWWDEWGAAVTASMTPAEGVEHVRAALAHIHEPLEDEPEPEGGDTEGEDGETEDGDGEPGEGKGKNPGPEGEPGIPDEDDDDDDTEGDDGDGDDDGEGNGGSETDAPPIDDEGEGEGQGTEGEGDESGTEGEGEGEGGGDESHGNTTGADTMDRTEGDKGSNDGPGAGGTGQAVAEAGDEDPDAGLNEHELNKSFDDFAESDAYRDSFLQKAVDEERVTSRFDAGIHGKMRVIFR